jgi:4-amino-4-deoxy-L-arabinose transferase-like glycosyltransferase
VFVALLILIVGLNIWWIATHRTSYSIDPDEGFLLGRAIRVADGSGLSSVIDTWTESSTSAPLLAITTGLLARVTGTSMVALLAPQIAALCILGVSVRSITERLRGQRWAAVAAAALVMTSPVAMNFTRAHHQIVPAAALTAVCVVLGLKSELLARRGLSVALGVAVGVALLTRAMLIAIVPWTILFAIPAAAIAGRPLRERMANGAIAAGTAVVVAGSWWVLRGLDTLDYLSSGSADALHPPPTSPDAWTRELRLALRVVGDVEAYDLRWAVWLTVVAAGIAAVVIVAPRLSGPERADGAYVVGVALAGFVALGIERDNFHGYELIVVPLAVAVGAAALSRLPRVGPVALGLVCALILQSLVLSTSYDAGWQAFRLRVQGGAAVSQAEIEAWGDANEQLVHQIEQLGGTDPRAMVLIEDPQVEYAIYSYVALREGLQQRWSRRPEVEWTDESLGEFLRDRAGHTLLVVPTDAPSPSGGLTWAEITDQLESHRCTMIGSQEQPDRQPTAIWRCRR